jgi:site-specific DNA-methyltransferase (adenine-specific)
MKFDLHHGDCLEVLRTMADNSADSIVTDPPYGLSFMGKKWDYDVPGVEVWAECLRVLKPGGHLLAFAGTRTQHRMAVRIEDAGFEIRDMIAWIYGSGFPKSHDVSKGIDKAAGVEREVIGRGESGKSSLMGGLANRDGEYGHAITSAATPEAEQWQGWGTALKPALEPITVARKPLIGTVAENVLAHGTGGLNIDGCRVAGVVPQVIQGGQLSSGGIMNANGGERGTLSQPHDAGRWPANLIHDGSDEVVAGFPQSNGMIGMTKHASGTNSVYGDYFRTDKSLGGSGSPDKGSAARFFYCAKASKRDRDEGLDGFEAKATAFGNQAQAELKCGNLDHDDGKSGMNKVKMRQNSHPTVKPTDLMRYLCRLVTPPGGVVLDPFMGSGSTGKAAMLEGFRFVGIEREAEYLAIARARIEAATTPEPEAEKPAAQTPKPKPATNRQNDLFSEAD